MSLIPLDFGGKGVYASYTPLILASLGPAWARQRHSRMVWRTGSQSTNPTSVPPVVKTSAAFLQLHNDAPTEQFVVSASTPIAGAVELHMHLHDNGVMRMRQIPHIHMPPGENVALEPGGLHIMLFDLKGTLREG